MITTRPASERGVVDHGWLLARHSFSFGRYHDPKHMGFRALRVINEDSVAPGTGFGEHPHQDMEIITYILDGALTHRDSMGHEQTIRPGDVQHMSAGTGIRHSEMNASALEPVHLLQIWIEPDRAGHEPRYGEIHLNGEGAAAAQLIASPDGAEGSLPIHSDTRVHAIRLGAGESTTIEVDDGRHAWAQVARGAIELNGVALDQGDGAAISDEGTLTFTARDEDAEVLVFDLA